MILQIILFVILGQMKQIETMSPALELTNNDFQASVWAHKYLLVYFYVPWCKHCQDFSPQYDQITNILLEQVQDIVVAKVDCDAQRSVCKSQSVNNFPTIKLFIEEKEHLYQGDRLQDDVIGWIIRKTKPPNTEIMDILQLAQIQTDREINFILFVNEQKNLDVLEMYQKLSFDFTDAAIFYHTNSESIRANYNITKDTQLIVIRNTDNIRVDFENSFTEENIIQFFRNESGEWVMDWNQDAAERIFAHLLPTLFFIKGLNNETNDKQEKIIQNLQLKGEIFICIVNHDQYANEIREYLDIPEQDEPLIRILKPMEKQDDPHQYIFDKEIDQENVDDFIFQYKRGLLQRQIKSEKQITQEGQILKLTGNVFKEFVINTDMDVLVNFYANWCQNCQKFEPFYQKLSELVQNQENLMITKIDSNLNDVDGVEIESYPTLYLYPKGMKQNPIKFDRDERTLESLVEFLQDNVQNDWIQSKYDYNMETKSDDNLQIENKQQQKEDL